MILWNRFSRREIKLCRDEMFPGPVGAKSLSTGFGSYHRTPENPGWVRPGSIKLSLLYPTMTSRHEGEGLPLFLFPGKCSSTLSLDSCCIGKGHPAVCRGSHCPLNSTEEHSCPWLSQEKAGTERAFTCQRKARLLFVF